MPGKYIFYDLETTGRGKKETSNSFNIEEAEKFCEDKIRKNRK